jgi:citrate synthase
MEKLLSVDTGELSGNDSRTGHSYTLPIQEGTIRAADLRQIRVGPDDFGLMAYDPGLTNTAVCHSAITFIDGDAGVLLYRGYPIDQIAERSTYVEVVHLLLNSHLPDRTELHAFERELAARAAVPAEVVAMIDALPARLHPMRVLMAAIAALGAFHPESIRVGDAAVQREQALTLVAQVGGLAAAAFRRFKGEPFVPADPALGFVPNLRHQLFSAPGAAYSASPVLERALDVLLILHADHEQNCSTSAVRSVASSEADPYSALAAGVGALFGPLHGGANEAVLKMLREIGSVKNVPAFVDRVKHGDGRLMGFGHRVYKSYDPRARIIKRTAEDVFAVTGVNHLLEIALELERYGLEDDYFVQRKLYPNVDFYSGLIYEAMGLPAEMFTVLFAVARTSGWAAQFLEFAADPERKIVRPRQLYTGEARRDLTHNG